MSSPRPARREPSPPSVSLPAPTITTQRVAQHLMGRGEHSVGSGRWRFGSRRARSQTAIDGWLPRRSEHSGRRRRVSAGSCRLPVEEERHREPALVCVCTRRVCGAHDSAIARGHDHAFDAAAATVAKASPARGRRDDRSPAMRSSRGWRGLECPRFRGHVDLPRFRWCRVAGVGRLCWCW